MRRRVLATVLAAGAGTAAIAGCTPEQIAAVQAAQNDQFSASRAWAAGSGPTAVRMCESGNNYGINTGNGYYGAWQFDLPSWYANGGGQFAGLPNYATKDQQDFVAYTYWQRAGWGPWSCKPW